MRKTARRAAVLTAAAAGVLAGVAAVPAQAAAPGVYAQPEVRSSSDVLVSGDGSAAFVKGVYRCFGGRQNTHLWVSVKQGPNVSLPDHTSSSYADAWYDTNFNYAIHDAGLAANCNGQWQTAVITLRPQFGQLQDGTGYVQFCLFDSTGGEDGGSGYAGLMEFRNVRHA